MVLRCFLFSVSAVCVDIVCKVRVCAKVSCRVCVLENVVLVEYKKRRKEKSEDLSFIPIMRLSAFRDNEGQGKVIRDNLVPSTPQKEGKGVRLDGTETRMPVIGRTFHVTNSNGCMVEAEQKT